MAKKSFLKSLIVIPIFLFGCDDPSVPSSTKGPKTKIQENSSAPQLAPPAPPVSEPIGRFQKVLTALTMPQEQRQVQIIELARQSKGWPLEDRLALIKYLDNLNLDQLGYDPPFLTELSIPISSGLTKSMDADSIISEVNSLKNAIFKSTLLRKLGDFMSLSNPNPADYIRLLGKFDSHDERNIFFDSLITTATNLPVETRAEAVRLLASQISNEARPAPDLATSLGSSLFMSKTEFRLPNHSINEVVTVSETFRNTPAIFEAFVSGFLTSYLEEDGPEASQWLLRQDKDWLGYGAPTVAEYIIRTDKAAGMEWLKKAYPDAKLKGATKVTLEEPKYQSQ